MSRHDDYDKLDRDKFEKGKYEKWYRPYGQSDPRSQGVVHLGQCSSATEDLRPGHSISHVAGTTINDIQKCSRCSIVLSRPHMGKWKVDQKVKQIERSGVTEWTLEG